jgi:putative ABC transport system permease protein
MLRATFTSLWARRRRVLGTSTAVVLGVAFLLATLMLSDTMDRSFTYVFRTDHAGTDVRVRNATVIDTDEDQVRGTLPADLADDLARIPGVAAVVPAVEATAQVVGSDGTPIGGDGPPTLARAWVDDPEINPFQIAAGRAPAADDEVVLDVATARRGDLRVGDRTTIRTPTPRDVTVVGTATFGGTDGMNGATYVGTTPDLATEILGRPDAVTAFLLRAEPGTTDEALRDAVAAMALSDVEAVTGGQAAAEDLAAAQGDFIDLTQQFLLAFAAVALVVAAFTIHNTFTIVMAQRGRETALMRAIGASRGQVLGAVLIEALVVAAVASVVGVAVGVGLAAALRRLLEGVGLDLAGTGLVITGTTVVISVAVAVITTVVASLVPAVRTARTAPIEALRTAEAEAPQLSGWRTGTGLGLAGLGIATTFWAPSADAPLAIAGAAAVAVLVATVLLGPTIARPMARLVGAPIAALRGQPGVLARRNVARNPRRAAASALALVMGTAVVALFATMGSSLRQSIDQTVSQSFGGDLAITQEGFSGAAISPELTPAVAALPEVAAAAALSPVTATHDGATVLPLATDPAALAQVVDLAVHDGDLAAMGTGQVALSSSYAEDHDLSRGDRLPLSFVDGTRSQLEVAVLYDQADLLGDVIMTTQDWLPHATGHGEVAVLVALADGVSLDEGRAAVEPMAERFAAPPVQDRDEYVASIAGEIDEVLTFVYAMLALAVLIALLGIANTLSLSIHERTRELGLLRAVGLDRRGLRGSVRWESVITAVMGTAVGLAVGTFLGWSLVRALAVDTEFMTFGAPSATLGVVVVLAMVAGVVAAIRPAHRAARLDVLAAIAER